MKTPTNASAAHSGATAMSRALVGGGICAQSEWYGDDTVGTKPVTVFADHKLRARRPKESLQ